MKRFNTYIYIIIVVILIIRCADDKTDNPNIPIPGKNYAELSIRLGKEIPTKADGDIPATDQEKKIESLACFVQTFDEGTIGQEGYRPGAFLKYFTHVAKESPNGFTDYDFNSDPPTVKIRIYSEGFKDLTQLVFIANYEQNGLKDALVDVTRMEDLAAIRTTEVTTQGIKYPLLMTGTAQVALSNGIVVNDLKVPLTRIMARIDIQNNANTGDKPFVMESAQVINPKLYSYLMEGNDDSYNIPVLSDGFTAAQPGATDPDLIQGLYTYETANDGTVEHTAMLLRGTLNGEPYTKRIDMQTAGQPVPLGRNKRYLITLNKTSSSQEITFTFKVDDWEDGTTFPVKPEHEKPSLAEFTAQKAPNGLADTRYWDATTHTYNLAYVQTNDILRFTYTGKQDIRIGNITLSKDDGTSIGLNPGEDLRDWITALPKEVNGETVKQTFEIRFRQRPTKDIHINIPIENAAKPTHKETIHLSCWYYPGTQFSPVKIGSVYWAPLNVGASILETPTPSNASMGYYYQWGRNKAFILTPAVPISPSIVGPRTLNEANGTYVNHYIAPAAYADWLSDTPANTQTRNNYWLNPVTTPCPAGWRMPTQTELQNVIDKYNNNMKVEETSKRFPVDGDDGQILYFPYMAYIGWNGTCPAPYERTLVWTTTLDATGIPFTMDITKGKSAFFHNWATSYAFSIRCVHDIQ